MSWRGFTGQFKVGALAAVIVAAAAAEGAGSRELVAGATVLAWWSVIVALIVRRLGGGPRLPLPAAAIAAGACLAGIAALSFLSLAWGGDAGRGFAVAVQAALYAGVFALAVVLATAGDARAWLRGLALGLAAVCAIALFGRLVPGIDADAGLVETLPSARGRLSFPIGYWNGLGAIAALALVLLAWAGTRGTHRLERAAATAAIPLACLAIYLTSSRGAIAAAAAGLAVLVALGPARTRVLGTAALGLAPGAGLAALAAGRNDFSDGLSTSAADSQAIEVLAATLVAVVLAGLARYLLDRPLATIRVPRLAGAIALAAGALALAGGVAAADPDAWIEEFREPPAEGAVDPAAGGERELVTASSHGRWQFWGAAVDAFGEEPLTGLGAGGFVAFWNQHGALPLAIEHAHSIFLDHLAELGPLGLALIVAALGVGLAAALRRRGATAGGEPAALAAVIAAATLAFAIDWSWSIPGVALPVIVALAVATGPSTLAAPGPAPATGDSPRARSGIGLATVTIVAAWAAIWAGGISLLTEIKVDQSQESAAADDLAGAAASAEDAIALQPWAAEPRLQLGLVLELGGEPDAARERLLQATDRAADDWSVWFVLSRLEASLGNADDAEEARARASMLLPVDAEPGGQ